MARAPAPLTSEDCDVSDHPWFPLHHRRLRKSGFWLRASDAVKVASVELWCEAFISVPAGSVPDDDIFLAEATGYGRKNVEQWLEIKSDVFGAWTLCSDGRYYHPTVCEVASDIFDRMDVKRRNGRERQKRHRDRIKEIRALVDGDDSSNEGAPAPLTRDKGTTGQDKTEQNRTESRAGEKIDREAARDFSTEKAGPDNMTLADYFEDQRNGQHRIYFRTPEKRKAEAWHMAKSVLELYGETKQAAGKCVGEIVREFKLDDDDLADLALRVYDAKPEKARPFLVGCARHFARTRDASEEFRNGPKPSPKEDADEIRRQRQAMTDWREKALRFPVRDYRAFPGSPGCTIRPEILREFGVEPWTPPGAGEFA